MPSVVFKIFSSWRDDRLFSRKHPVPTARVSCAAVLFFLFQGKGSCFHLLTKSLFTEYDGFSHSLSFSIHQALSLIMLNFAPACHRCLSNPDSIVCRLFSLYSLPLNLCTSAKNYSRVPLSSSLGISSSLWGSSCHLLHTSNQFTHILVDLDVILFKFSH